MLSQPTSASADPVELSTASAGSLMLVAAIFSRRCATEEVPGISRIVAECCSSHASATCRGDAPSRAATASRRALEASPHLKRGRAAVRDGAPTAARHERRGLSDEGAAEAYKLLAMAQVRWRRPRRRA